MQGNTGNSSNNNNSTRRRRAITRNGVVVRSVWETRMKMDEVQGGIKVFNAGECDANAADEEGLRVYRRLRRNQSDGAAAAAERKKRRSWSTSGGGPVALRKSRSELSNPQKASAAAAAAAAEKQVLLICDGKDEGEEEVADEEKRESFDDKEMDKPLEKPKNSEEEEGGEEAEEEAEEEEEEEEEKEINKIHEIPMSPKAKNNAELDSETIKTPQETIQIHQEPLRSLSENKSDPMVACRDLNPKPVKSPQEKKLVVMNQRAINPEPSPEKRKPEPVIIRRATKLAPTKSPPVEFYDNKVPENIGANHNKMQNIVDLVMWRDVSKSAFVFGLGTFSLISSSYAKDLNFCLISSFSYLGLVYLALMFLYKSILRRGEGVECDEESYYCMVGEEEAIWAVRLLLPYINELLLKLRALFSGDPATTMKLALLLFALARCGSSVTVWTLAKLGFFGVFTVPKVCSSYSIQLARYGKFWLERFRDGWESCTHKKAVAAAAFTLIWNVSSTVARIWAVFMLVVAVKLYQQRIADEWSSCGEEVAEDQGAEDFRKEPSPIKVGRGTKIKRRL